MWNTFLKRLFATIGMILSYLTMSGGFDEFRDAESGIPLFRGLFFGIIGATAFILFLRDFIKKRWPFQFED